VLREIAVIVSKNIILINPILTIMALTIFHVTVVWPLFIIKPKKFDFLGLTMGATIPDFFLPFTLTLFRDYYWEVRVITHSLLGAVTIDLLLGAVGAIVILPVLINFIRKRSADPRVYTFSGVDVIKDRPGKLVILYSVFIGILSHLFIDLFYHRGTPLFSSYGSYEILINNDIQLTGYFIRPVLIFGFLMLAYFHWFKLPEKKK
jgi:hypothetical protein